jgi:hypothetical protein
MRVTADHHVRCTTCVAVGEAQARHQGLPLDFWRSTYEYEYILEKAVSGIVQILAISIGS